MSGYNLSRLRVLLRLPPTAISFSQSGKLFRNAIRSNGPFCLRIFQLESYNDFVPAVMIPLDYTDVGSGLTDDRVLLIHSHTYNT